MLELKNQIARLEMRSEQLRIHVRSLDRASLAAEQARSDLLVLLLKLVVLKGRQERLELELNLEAAA